MKRNFNDLMLSLKKSITPADFFVDFSKVYLNIKDYERHLNLLNSLIGKENIEEEFVVLINEYPEIMKSIPILLATHEYKFHIINASTVSPFLYEESVLSKSYTLEVAQRRSLLSIYRLTRTLSPTLYGLDCSLNGSNKSLASPQSRKAPILVTCTTSSNASLPITIFGVVVVAIILSIESL